MSNLETNTVLKALAAQGWKLSQTSARGYKAVPPDAGKDIVYFAGRDESRSGTRAWKNSLKALRRSGFEWPQPAAERQQTNGAGDDQVDELEVPVPTAEAPEPPVLLADESAGGDLDALWVELKEAREYLVLADEQLVHCTSALQEAQRAFAEAQAEREKSAERLRARKAELDRAFETARPA